MFHPCSRRCQKGWFSAIQDLKVWAALGLVPPKLISSRGKKIISESEKRRDGEKLAAAVGATKGGGLKEKARDWINWIDEWKSSMEQDMKSTWVNSNWLFWGWLQMECWQKDGWSFEDAQEVSCVACSHKCVRDRGRIGKRANCNCGERKRMR